MATTDDRRDIMKQALELGRQLNATTEVNGIPAVWEHPEWKLRTLEKLLPHPQRKEGVVHLDHLQSFIDYVSHHKETGTAIFVSADNVKETRFTAKIDYHEASSNGAAGWREHTAIFCPTLTEPMKVWLLNSGKKMNQVEFAFFVEENRAEILEPSGTDMLRLATSLKAKAEANYDKGVTLQNGEIKFHYVETIEATAGRHGEMTIPEEMVLAIPIFRGDQVADRFPARFRYRVGSGALQLWYELIRPYEVFDGAVASLVLQIQSALGCNLYYGNN